MRSERTREGCIRRRRPRCGCRAYRSTCADVIPPLACAPGHPWLARTRAGAADGTRANDGTVLDRRAFTRAGRRSCVGRRADRLPPGAPGAAGGAGATELACPTPTRPKGGPDDRFLQLPHGVQHLTPPQQHGAHREDDPSLLITLRGAPKDAEGKNEQQVTERSELNDEQRHHCLPTALLMRQAAGARGPSRATRRHGSAAPCGPSAPHPRPPAGADRG